MFPQALSLIQSRITGARKGMDAPAWQHSVRVSELLRDHGYDETLQLAGLLHDIVEDGGTQLDELRQMGFPDRVVELVDLASHNDEIKDKYLRWATMMQRILSAGDLDAFALKLADYSDNLSECLSMPDEEKLRKFLLLKGSFFCYHGYKLLGESSLYAAFMERYWAAVNGKHGLF
jgi:(p)ppGpp synthase/HD superfamily hydrolase